MRKFAARTKKKLLEANQRLNDDAAFYEDVQKEFSK